MYKRDRVYFFLRHLSWELEGERESKSKILSTVLLYFLGFVLLYFLSFVLLYIYYFSYDLVLEVGVEAGVGAK